VTRRAERTNDRQVHAIAKAIHEKMKDGTLDEITLATFKWIKNRSTAAEREV
jgi:hypothetical protein